MKRIIAFVLFGLMIYAGIFVIYYSITDIRINTAVPADMKNISADDYHSGLVLEGSVYQVLEGELYTEKYHTNIFSGSVDQHFFALPLGTAETYLILGVSDEKDLEMIKQLQLDEPRERAEGDPALDFIGIVGDMSPTARSILINYLSARPELIGLDNYLVLTEAKLQTAALNRIVPYVIYIKHPKGTDIVPLIIGIAMCVIGLVLAILLARRIKDEKESY